MDSYTKFELLADMDVSMGGRAAEELIFGTEKVSLGAFGDFKVIFRIRFYTKQFLPDLHCNKKYSSPFSLFKRRQIK